MKNLHHSHIVLSHTDQRQTVFDILKQDLGFEIQQNPDFLLLESDTFGIDEVKDLERWVIKKPFLSEVKASLLLVDSITFEAQNALLKILEEPPLGTYFFIHIGSLQNLLPTFLSRVQVLDLTKETRSVDSESLIDATKFLRSDLKQKFALIRSLAKSDDKKDMKDLIQNLEMAAYKDKSTHNQLKNILVAKTLVSARGSSPKMLLEWLSGMI